MITLIISTTPGTDCNETKVMFATCTRLILGNTINVATIILMYHSFFCLALKRFRFEEKRFGLKSHHDCASYFMFQACVLSFCLLSNNDHINVVMSDKKKVTISQIID